MAYSHVSTTFAYNLPPTLRMSVGADGELVRTALQQIGQALVVFSGALDLVQTPEEQPVTRLRLQRHARQVEDAMRQLREWGLLRSPAATELSQSLTVLVLVADMIASGQLDD